MKENVGEELRQEGKGRQADRKARGAVQTGAGAGFVGTQGEGYRARKSN